MEDRYTCSLFAWQDQIAQARLGWKPAGVILVFVVAYVAMSAGPALLREAPVAPILPAAAIGYAAVLCAGWRLWPLLIVADLLATFAAGHEPRLLQVIGNVLAPLAGAWVVYRLRPRTDLSLTRVQDVAVVLIPGGLAASATCAILGAPALLLDGVITSGQLIDTTLTWALGHQLGIIAFTPFALTAILWLTGNAKVCDAAGGRVENMAASASAALLISALLLTEPSALVPTLALFIAAFGLWIWIALRCFLWQTYMSVAMITMVATVTGMELIQRFPDIAFGLRWGVMVPYVSMLSLLTVVVAAGRTEKAEYARHLLFRSNHDPLTGLLNRDAFETLLREAMHSPDPSAMCYIDLDQFKIVNDTYGHAVGDRLLHQLAEHLRESVKGDFEIARLGGDEFGVLLRGDAANHPHRSADTLRRAIEALRFAHDGRMHAISASIGVVPLRELPEPDFDAALSVADAACFAAKDLGRNRTYVFSPEDAGMAQRLEEMAWTSRLSHALDHDQFQILCQSIVPLGTDDTARRGVEMLTRMIGDKGQAIEPARFIPMAEQYDIMPRLDRWVTGAVLRWMSAHPEELDRVAFVSINLSGASLTNRDFRHHMLGALRELDFPSDKLCFEVTETATIANLDSARSFMQELRAMGCHLALDDFGSGLSSFGYLQDLPVDFLKIDGQFVREMPRGDLSRTIVGSINELGHLLGMKVIGEQAEDQATVDQLKALGVDYAQGHFFDEPIPIDHYFRCRRRSAKPAQS